MPFPIPCSVPSAFVANELIGTAFAGGGAARLCSNFKAN